MTLEEKAVETFNELLKLLEVDRSSSLFFLFFYRKINYRFFHRHVFASTRFVFALNVISSDGAVAIKAHGPAESYGPIFNLPDLYLRRVGRF